MYYVKTKQKRANILRIKIREKSENLYK